MPEHLLRQNPDFPVGGVSKILIWGLDADALNIGGAYFLQRLIISEILANDFDKNAYNCFEELGRDSHADEDKQKAKESLKEALDLVPELGG